MAGPQLDLFGTDPPPPAAPMPEGFSYCAELISPSEETALLDECAALPFRAFEFHGYEGKRRVVSFGWEYDFARERVRRTGDLPPFLLGLQEKAASFAGLAARELPHALVTEYQPGAAIGWHKDKGVFGDVVGISLLAPCTFHLRRRAGSTWERASLLAGPRSAYLLRGAARREWEHSIPPVASLRYSITFRTLERS
jgi:alkylated DNA repair dioxygenase AlkB